MALPDDIYAHQVVDTRLMAHLEADFVDDEKHIKEWHTDNEQVK